MWLIVPGLGTYHQELGEGPTSSRACNPAHTRRTRTRCLLTNNQISLQVITVEVSQLRDPRPEPRASSVSCWCLVLRNTGAVCCCVWWWSWWWWWWQAGRQAGRQAGHVLLLLVLVQQRAHHHDGLGRVQHVHDRARRGGVVRRDLDAGVHLRGGHAADQQGHLA